MKHIPVMVNEVIANLPENVNLMMDGTLGHGGHTKYILSKKPNLKIIGVDKDPLMLEKAKQNLQNYPQVEFVNSSYKDLDRFLPEKVDAILLDLGVNMEHFKDAKRGFSIKSNGPLDMRFNPSSKITAEWILKNYTQQQLEEILQKYGDFKGVLLKRIVAEIIKGRGNLKTTFDLKNLLKRAGLSEKKIAVVFQVLRIETNKELEELEQFLEKFGDWLNKGGRCLIITYHSIEDRLVKNKFKQLHNNGFINLTKKVIFPTWEEIQSNKASRSAKLRIIEKI